MAQAVNKTSSKPLEKFLAELRKGPPSIAKSKLEADSTGYSSRRPKVDDDIRRVLSMNAVKAGGKYLYQLKKIFSAFHHENQKSSKI